MEIQRCRFLKTSMWLAVFLSAVQLFHPSVVPAEEKSQDNTGSEYFDLSLEELLDINVNKDQFLGTGIVFYGYVNANVEKVFNIPYVDANGDTKTASDPMEWSQPNFHLYGTAQLNKNIDVLFNLEKGSGDSIDLINAYGNMKKGDPLQLRVGKQYRQFGLFNEKLDQAPAILGIEPPELLDKDHLLLPRTTIAMFHGSVPTGLGEVSYAISTDNGEGGAQKNVLPMGYDVRVKGGSYIFGMSGYFSSLSTGKTTPSVAEGDGPPTGAVLPWMTGDKYYVLGGYVEATALQNFILQAAYWFASHDAMRDPDSVMTLYNNAGLNAHQINRFFGGGAPVVGNVVEHVNYDVKTWYVRMGYTIPTDVGTFTPYAFLDWMSNPEEIRSKTYGGDNEAGFADNGIFFKPSLGIVYKPIPVVAIKADGSIHTQKFNGSTETYPEGRLDISFAFK